MVIIIIKNKVVIHMKYTQLDAKHEREREKRDGEEGNTGDNIEQGAERERMGRRRSMWKLEVVLRSKGLDSVT